MITMFFNSRQLFNVFSLLSSFTVFSTSLLPFERPYLYYLYDLARATFYTHFWELCSYLHQLLLLSLNHTIAWHTMCSYTRNPALWALNCDPYMMPLCMVSFKTSTYVDTYCRFNWRAQLIVLRSLTLNFAVIISTSIHVPILPYTSPTYINRF